MVSKTKNAAGGKKTAPKKKKAAAGKSAARNRTRDDDGPYYEDSRYSPQGAFQEGREGRGGYGAAGRAITRGERERGRGGSPGMSNMGASQRGYGYGPEGAYDDAPRGAGGRWRDPAWESDAGYEDDRYGRYSGARRYDRDDAPRETGERRFASDDRGYGRGYGRDEPRAEYRRGPRGYAPDDWDGRDDARRGRNAGRYDEEGRPSPRGDWRE